VSDYAGPIICREPGRPLSSRVPSSIETTANEALISLHAGPSAVTHEPPFARRELDKRGGHSCNVSHLNSQIRTPPRWRIIRDNDDDMTTCTDSTVRRAMHDGRTPPAAPADTFSRRHHERLAAREAAARAAAIAAEEPTHIAVSLPLQRTNRAAPGGAMRVPPVPPPRPESTISPWTRDVSPPVPPRPAASRAGGDDRGLLATVSLPMNRPPAQPPASPPTTRPSPISGTISLTAPRPGQERTQNLYVDAPLKPELPQRQANPPDRPLRRAVSELRSSTIKPKPQEHRLLSPSRLLQTGPSSDLAPVPSSVIGLPTKAKKASSSSDGGTLKKPLALLTAAEPPAKAAHRLSDYHSSSAPFSASPQAQGNDSIICRECGRCKCDACRSPRRLPERWLCDGACRLSVGAAIDAISCMFLVRACFYHTDKDDGGGDSSEHPCACSPLSTSCVGRWACMTASSTSVLPCLCLYPPLKACAAGAEAVYKRTYDVGCKCEDKARKKREKEERRMATITREPPSISSTTTSSLASTPLASPARSGQHKSGADSEKRLLG